MTGSMTEMTAWVPAVLSVVALLTVILKVGRYSQHAEDRVAHLKMELTNCRAQCDARVQAQVAQCTQRMQSYEALVSTEKAYSHESIHEIRNVVQELFGKFDLRYAQKDALASLKELMLARFDGVDKRMDAQRASIDSLARRVTNEVDGGD